MSHGIRICLILVTLACCSCRERNPQTESSFLPLNVTPPVIVKAYNPLDCGACELLLQDKSGRELYLFNKPFHPELFLSAQRCSSEPDMACSIQITAELLLRETLITCLGQFLESRCDATELERIRETKDFISLSKDDKILSGTLMILNSLKEIKQSANQRVESTVLPKRQN